MRMLWAHVLVLLGIVFVVLFILSSSFCTPVNIPLAEYPVNNWMKFDIVAGWFLLFSLSGISWVCAYELFRGKEANRDG